VQDCRNAHLVLRPGAAHGSVPRQCGAGGHVVFPGDAAKRRESPAACGVQEICGIVPSGMLPGRRLKTGAFDEDQREEAPQ
jgi:hypothetical protein